MSDDSNFLDYAWGKILLGAALLGLAFWLNSDFKAMETGARESVRVNWILALLYKNLGRQVTVAIAGLAGAAGLVLGVRQLLSERE